MDQNTIAILGGTGTLGRAIVRQLQKEKARFKVLIFSRDEIKQLEMMDDCSAVQNIDFEYKLGDVRDKERLEEVLKGYEYVIHAAAIKHVVMAENNPEECRKTNVEGTKNVIRACEQHEIKSALFISTDKAYQPIGVYGRSKENAEKWWLAANNKERNPFKIMRLGNIIGSRGSVFEAFERQKKSGVIRVTDPEATRFCISQEAAAKFVLAELFKNGGELISAPKMETFKVMDLAKELAPDCRIEIVGLRPGDKLHEELDGTSSRH